LDSGGRITPEGVLKPSLDRLGVALYNGVLQETIESGESATSNATLFLSAGVLASVFVIAVILPRIGDSAVLGKAVGDSTDLINGVDAFICSP